MQRRDPLSLLGRTRPRLAGAFLPLLLGLAACVAASDGAREERIESLIETGRVALEERRPAEAQERFEQAAKIEDSLRTRLWVLRAWMDQGRGNDALRAIDELVQAGHEGPEIDYLYGMAFVRQGHEILSQGMKDESVRRNFQDGRDLLVSALGAEPERFGDGWLSLARATWELGLLEEARVAVERAVERRPADPAARLLEARIARSQLQALLPEGTGAPAAWTDAARAHYERAVRAYRRTRDLVDEAGEATDEGEWHRKLLVAASLELGWLLVRGGDEGGAAKAYGDALGWDRGSLNPANVYAELVPQRSLLEIERSHRQEGEDEDRFLAALERACAIRAEHPAGSEPDANLAWWRAYALWATGRVDEAEASFLRCLEERPEFVNSWFYVSVIRSGRGDTDGAIAALRAGWEIEPVAMLTLIVDHADPVLHQVETWITTCVEAERWSDAAVLSEIVAEANPTNPRLWNNLGFLLREAGQATQDPALSTRIFEAAFQAYGRGLQIAPDDPQLVNDAAVVLDVYLDRDLPLALDMYERAAALAAQRLTGGLLPAEDRARFVQAAEDARRNRELLLRRLGESPGAAPEGER